MSRRAFLGSSVASGALGLSLGSIPIVLKADNHRLEESDPTAQVLGYRHDATQVDVSQFPRRAGPDGQAQFCDNCALYAPEGDSGWGGCSIFPGKLVKGRGWCNAWVGQ